MPVQANIVKIIIATSQFIATPANRILVFAQNPALPKVPARVSAADSPSIWQKPPIGSQFRLKIMPFWAKSLLPSEITTFVAFSFVHSLRGSLRHLPVLGSFIQAIARGGKPIPNSSTFTPLRRAAIKCPNSCAVTKNISTKSPTITPTNISISLLYHYLPNRLLRLLYSFIIILISLASISGKYFSRNKNSAYAARHSINPESRSSPLVRTTISKSGTSG